MHHVDVVLQQVPRAYVTVKSKENVIAMAPVLVRLVFVSQLQKVTSKL